MRRIPAHFAMLATVALAIAAVTVLVPWDARAVSSHAVAPVPARPATTPAPVTAAATSMADRAEPPVPAPLLTPPLILPDQWQLAVTYHAQQNWDWCDPADIEMWLQSDGVALPGGDDYSIQGRFWEYETADNDGYSIAQWNSSPYAVAVTLDRFGGWTDIGDDPQPTSDAAGTVISYSLAVLHQPVIVMVDGGNHYVLVTGVTLGSGGTDAPPLTVTIADPLAYGVGATPPAGSNGLTTMDWDRFTHAYTANTSHGGIWGGQWVVIAAGIPLAG